MRVPDLFGLAASKNGIKYEQTDYEMKNALLVWTHPAGSATLRMADVPNKQRFPANYICIVTDLIKLFYGDPTFCVSTVRTESEENMSKEEYVSSLRLYCQTVIFWKRPPSSQWPHECAAQVLFCCPPVIENWKTSPFVGLSAVTFIFVERVELSLEKKNCDEFASTKWEYGFSVFRYSQSESWVHWAHCHPLSSTPNLTYYQFSLSGLLF